MIVLEAGEQGRFGWMDTRVALIKIDGDFFFFYFVHIQIKHFLTELAGVTRSQASL